MFAHIPSASPLFAYGSCGKRGPKPAAVRGGQKFSNFLHGQKDSPEGSRKEEEGKKKGDFEVPKKRGLLRQARKPARKKPKRGEILIGRK